MPKLSDSLIAQSKITRTGGYNCTPEKPVYISAKTYDRLRPTPVMDMHAELEIYIHLAGGIRRFWKGLTIDAKPGDVCFSGSFEPHGYQLLDVPAQGIVMEIAPSLITNAYFPEYPAINWLSLFTTPPAQRPRATPQTRTRVQGLATRLLAYGQGDTPQARLYRRLALFELLAMFENKEAPPTPRRQRQPPDLYARLEPAIALATHSRQLIPNIKAAAACGMKCNPFIQVFEKVMGVSFTKFALRHRIDAACKAVALTDTPIKVIAEEFGFANVSHLHRLFTAHYHCSPPVFRQRTKERAASQKAPQKPTDKTT
jgi:AraC-like DNA-binding protein